MLKLLVEPDLGVSNHTYSHRASRASTMAPPSVDAISESVPSDITLGEQIGRGSYGSVYVARHGGRQVAVKAVPVEEGDDGDALKGELQTEIKMLKECDSQWVVRYFGCFAKARMLWICMEYCDGGSISDVLRSTRTPLMEDEIAAVCMALVSGLQYLHETRQILHRDVKAGNVLLSTADGGGIKLCDLGVSASVASHTKRSTVIGTPLWMSPELIESGAYGASTDVWSLGITALEMAELNPPHYEVSPTIRALFLITSQPPPRLKEAAERWSAEFDDFVACCLVKDPEARASAATLRAHAFVQKGARLGTEPLPRMLERKRAAAAVAASGSRAADGGGGANHNATLDMMQTCDSTLDGTLSMEKTMLSSSLSGRIPSRNTPLALGGSRAAALLPSSSSSLYLYDTMDGTWDGTKGGGFFPRDDTLSRDGTLPLGGGGGGGVIGIGGTLPRDGTLRADDAPLRPDATLPSSSRGTPRLALGAAEPGGGGAGAGGDPSASLSGLNDSTLTATLAARLPLPLMPSVRRAWTETEAKTDADADAAPQQAAAGGASVGCECASGPAGGGATGGGGGAAAAFAGSALARSTAAAGAGPLPATPPQESVPKLSQSVPALRPGDDDDDAEARAQTRHTEPPGGGGGGGGAEQTAAERKYSEKMARARAGNLIKESPRGAAAAPATADAAAAPATPERPRRGSADLAAEEIASSGGGGVAARKAAFEQRASSSGVAPSPVAAWRAHSSGADSSGSVVGGGAATQETPPPMPDDDGRPQLPTRRSFNSEVGALVISAEMLRLQASGASPGGGDGAEQQLLLHLESVREDDDEDDEQPSRTGSTVAVPVRGPPPPSSQPPPAHYATMRPGAEDSGRSLAELLGAASLELGAIEQAGGSPRTSAGGGGGGDSGGGDGGGGDGGDGGLSASLPLRRSQSAIAETTASNTDAAPPNTPLLAAAQIAAATMGSSNAETRRASATTTPPTPTSPTPTTSLTPPAFVELARAAATPERAPQLVAAGATSVLLRGLASPELALQQLALQALLSLSLHAPEAQQRLVERSLLETVLGMAFYNGRSVRQQALHLLATLAANTSCAKILCEEVHFKTILPIIRLQAEHTDHVATVQALHLVDALLANDGLRTEQLPPALALAKQLSESTEDDAVRAAAEQTVSALARRTPGGVSHRH